MKHGSSVHVRCHHDNRLLSIAVILILILIVGILILICAITPACIG